MVKFALTAVLTATLAHGAILVNVSVDTSTLSGLMGFLNFALAPGSDSDPATARITGFLTDGTLGPGVTQTGDVTGFLPLDVVLGNSTPFNDYFQEFTFGASIVFKVVLDGTVFTSPRSDAGSGSDFGFAMFASDGFTPLLSANPEGWALRVAISPQGGVTLTSEPSVMAAVPEPSTLALVALAAAGLLARQQRMSRLKAGSSC